MGAVVKIGKRTEKLIREAMVAAFVDGVHCGRYGIRDVAGWPVIPKDSEITRRAFAVARSMPDLYPALSKLTDATNEGEVS